MWELSDPAISTRRKGSALDKFLILPGTNVPVEWPPSQSRDWVDAEGSSYDGGLDLTIPPFYPVHTFGFPVIADHHPVMQRLAGKREDRLREQKAFRLKNITAEEWADMENFLMMFLHDNSPYFADCLMRNKTTRYLQKLQSGVRHFLGEHYRRRQASPTLPNSFDLSCRKHLQDPEYPLLIRAHTEGNDLLKQKTINAMARRGWRLYLSKIRPSNVSALFSFLAKREGRKPRADHFPCASTLYDSEGILRFTNEEKCALLADHFGRRFASPALLEKLTTIEQYQTTLGPVTSGRHHPVVGKSPSSHINLVPIPAGPYRKPVEGFFPARTETEATNAFPSLSPKKAPGPHGLMAELFRNLPRLLSPVTTLFNMRLATGRFPQSMVQLYLIFLDKPHKPQDCCGSTRPISLMSVLSRALEAAILNRLMEKLEMNLTDVQYA